MWLSMLTAGLALGTAVDAAEPVTSRAQLTLGTSLGGTLQTPAVQPPESESVLSGSAGLGARIFLRPLIDDEDPRSLQPFLQRASMVGLSVGGSGFTSTYTRPGSLEATRRYARGSVSAWADLYLGRSVLLSASLGFLYTKLTDTLTAAWSVTAPRAQSSEKMFLPASLGLSVRVGDVLIGAAYSVDPFTKDGGPWQVPFWGGVSASLRAVLSRTTDLSLRAALLDHGAIVVGSAATYPSRELGFFGEMFYAHGRLYFGETEERDRAGGEFGGLCWFSRRFGAQLGAEVVWTGSTPKDPRASIDLTGTLTFFSRL